jgi:tetratricopeptide (TPR) repeat protein
MKQHRIPAAAACCAIIVAALCIPAGVTAAPADPAADTCLRGAELAKNNEYRQAIEQYTICLNGKELSDVVRAGVLVDRGNAYSKTGDPDRAIADFTQAIKVDPVSAVAYNNRANALRNKKRFAEALEDFSKALELSPMNTMVYNNRANTYKSLGKYDKAAADLDKAIELNPSNAVSYYNRACLESVRKNTASACDWLDKAIGKGFVEYDVIRADKDLENIRGDACYEKLLKGK